VLSLSHGVFPTGTKWLKRLGQEAAACRLDTGRSPQ
jgi:hypothetical protein